MNFCAFLYDFGTDSLFWGGFFLPISFSLFCGHQTSLWSGIFIKRYMRKISVLCLCIVIRKWLNSK